MPNYTGVPAPTQTTAVAKPSEQLQNILNSQSVALQFKRALGEHKDQFFASLIDLFTQDKQLQKCPPKLVVAEALRAAVLGLPLTKALGYSYIVVYNNSVKNPDGTWGKVSTPTFILGYKGLIQLALRSGQYRTINADVVYEGELSVANKLTGEIRIEPENRINDNVVGYFAYFEMLNGFSKTLYMSVEDMAKYAKKYSPSVPKEVTWGKLAEKAQTNEASKQVGWMGNFTDMALKTVLRRLLNKWGYLSTQMQTAMAKESEDEERQNERQSMVDAAKEEAETISLDSSMYSEVPLTPDEDIPSDVATPQF